MSGDKSLEGLRLLLVEDQALLAMMLEDFLAALGCVIVGNAGSVVQALPLAREADIDGAVLDVNLAGEPAWPVAEALTARQLPFLFLTGYADGTIDPRFAATAVLRKPVGLPALEAALLPFRRARDLPPA